MKKKIKFDIFKRNQLKAQKTNNQIQTTLYSASYDRIKDILNDVKRPFSNICIHGFYPNLIVQYLQSHRYKNHKYLQTVDVKDNLRPSITIVDYLNNLQQKNFQSEVYSINLVNVQHSQQWILQQDKFDLIVSCLQWNHVNSEQNLLKLYLNSLKPDGALVGCVMASGTLSELNWCYLMAENQRYGGVSPKVLGFPQIGQVGNSLTAANYHISTVLNQDYKLQFDNPLDLLKAIQIIGQSGHLRGRRKAVYKDLLIAMYALYQSQFSQILNQNQQKVFSSLVLTPFIGWKFSQRQKKPLRRGQVPKQLNFIDQLKKQDQDFQHYIIKQDSQEAELVESKKKKD